MADPVSFVAAGIGIGDVTLRVVRYLQDVNAAAKTVNNDIAALIAELEALREAHSEVERELLSAIKNKKIGQQEKVLWFKAGRTLKDGQKLVGNLEACIKEIYVNNRTVTGKLDSIRKGRRKRSKDRRISEFRDQISMYHGALHICLDLISIRIAREQHEAQSSMLAHVLLSVNRFESKLQQIQDAKLSPDEVVATSALYRDLTSIPMVASSTVRPRIASTNNIGDTLIPKSARFNKHFDTPTPVSKFYTGREVRAEQLRSWLLPNTDEERSLSFNEQTRFVVYGLGGSGKTQFCSKFAEDNRERFWGVFWVDGSSHQRLRQSFSTNIASVAGVDPNVTAALHWLSNLDESWLLIIDNADEPDLKLADFLPQGTRGHVFITTRDPGKKVYGNVGPGCFELRDLEQSDAISLLLKTCGHSQRSDGNSYERAAIITRHLGYLPLAIAQAGATIRTGVYATFELTFQTIEHRNTEAARDALQLLNTFAFLHHENIRFDFLRRAVTNEAVERTQSEVDRDRDALVSSPSKYWSAWAKDTVSSVLGFVYTNRSPPALVNLIRDGRQLRMFDSNRLRAALRELTQLALLEHDEKTDSYSMHPLVHMWARERPGMRIAEQSLWSEAAALMLSHCILLPPLGNTTEDEDLRKDLLPHIDHVRECQSSIQQRIRENRGARTSPWPVLQARFDREQALMYAKFSMVYAQNGRWEDAKRLQEVVMEFTMELLGLGHVIPRRMALVLANTLVALGRYDDAAALQQRVLDACIAHLGPDHHETLVAKDMLGETWYHQGRYHGARTLQEEAVAGLMKVYGHYHEDTLNAIDHLGRTISASHTAEDIRRARQLHLNAVGGMREVHGPEHLRTLIACENICVTAVYSGDHTHLLEAHEMMLMVLEKRKEKLGKEHAHTLLAMVNLARVKGGLHDFKAAEELILVAQPIAERNLGADHFGCLWGKVQLGKIWVHQQRWEEAEKLLVDVTECQLHLHGANHQDRLVGLVDLATVYNALGKYEECNRITEEALDGFNRNTMTSEHAIARKLREDRDEWRKRWEKKTDEVT